MRPLSKWDQLLKNSICLLEYDSDIPEIGFLLPEIWGNENRFVCILWTSGGFHAIIGDWNPKEKEAKEINLTKVTALYSLKEFLGIALKVRNLILASNGKEPGQQLIEHRGYGKSKTATLFLFYCIEKGLIFSYPDQSGWDKEKARKLLELLKVGATQ